MLLVVHTTVAARATELHENIGQVLLSLNESSVAQAITLSLAFASVHARAAFLCLLAVPSG
jgi:hypothetical protein